MARGRTRPEDPLSSLARLFPAPPPADPVAAGGREASERDPVAAGGREASERDPVAAGGREAPERGVSEPDRQHRRLPPSGYFPVRPGGAV